MSIITQPSNFNLNNAGHFKLYEIEINNSLHNNVSSRNSRTGKAMTGNGVGYTSERQYLNNGYNKGNPFIGVATPGQTFLFPGIIKNYSASEFVYSVINQQLVHYEFYHLTRSGKNNYTRTTSPLRPGESLSRFGAVKSGIHLKTLPALSAQVCSLAGLTDSEISYNTRAFVCWDKYALFATRYITGGNPDITQTHRRATKSKKPYLAYLANFIITT